MYAAVKYRKPDNTNLIIVALDLYLCGNNKIAKTN
jgi:hypothetical protein